MSLCKSKTTKGLPCTRKAKDGSEYCYQHQTSRKGQPTIHPPFKNMICSAIASLSKEDKRKGASRDYIKKYLAANFNIPSTNPFINKTLLKMLRDHELVTNTYHRGHYKLSPEYAKTLASNQQKIDDKIQQKIDDKIFSDYVNEMENGC